MFWIKKHSHIRQIVLSKWEHNPCLFILRYFSRYSVRDNFSDIQVWQALKGILYRSSYVTEMCHVLFKLQISYMPQNAVGLLSSKATPTLARASPVSAKPGLRSPTLKRNLQKFSTACKFFACILWRCLPVHKSGNGKLQSLWVTK